MNSLWPKKTAESENGIIRIPDVPDIPEDIIGACNRLCAASGIVNTSICGVSGITWNLCAADKPSLLGYEAVLNIAVSDAKASLFIDRLPKIETPHCFAGRDIRELAEPLRNAILESMLEPVLLTIRETSGINAELSISDAKEEPLSKDNPAFQFVCLGGSPEKQFSGVLVIEKNGLDLFADIAESMIDKKEENWDSLFTSVSICIGRTEITLKDASGIRPGDILVMDVGREFTVYAGEDSAFSAAAVLDGKSIVLQGGLMETEISELGENTEDAYVESFDMLKVKLTFEVGRKIMTIAELRELSKGSVLELDNADSLSVTVRINGLIAGKGHIVDIAGKSGIRIDSIVPPKASERETGANE